MKINITIPEKKDGFDVVGLGLNAIDHLIVLPRYPDENTKTGIQTHELQGGGQMGTGLTALARLGAKTRYLGKVGDDWQGETSLEIFKTEGVDISCVRQVTDAPNLFSYIIVNRENGSRTILTKHSEKLKLEPGDFPRESVLSGRILYLDGSGEECALQCARWAHEERIPIIMDVERMKPCLPEMMEIADGVITSENFLNKVYPNTSPRDFLEILNDTYRLPFCAVTLGDRGSLGYNGKDFIETPAYPVEVVDSTGAGDVYHGAFIYGLLQNWEAEAIMRFASAAAALKCRHLGGRKGAPKKEEVLDFLSFHNETIM